MALTRLQAPTTAIAEAAAKNLREHGYEATSTGWFVDAAAGQHLVAFAIYEAACITRSGPLPDPTPAPAVSPASKVTNG